MDSAGERILDLIRTGRAVSRAQLVRASGLARGTVSVWLDRLIAAGIVAIDEQVRDTGGRPADRLAINPAGGVLLGADIGGSHTKVGVMDLARGVLATRDRVMDVNEGPEFVLSRVYDDFAELLAEAGREADEVFGVAIGLPGPVEQLSGRVVSPPTMNGWDGFSVPDFSATRLAAPVFVDKDANLLALGEYHALAEPVQDVLVLKVGMGIGAGIIANGAIIRGGMGGAGDLGHLPRRGGEACRCGQFGCAEATAGGWAIARALREDGFADTWTSQDILALAHAKEPAALELLRGAGHRLGDVLADAIGILNPSVVIIAGNLATSSDVLLAGIRNRIYEKSHPLATQNLRIEVSRLGDAAGLAGAARLAADVAFAGDRVAELMAT